MGEIFLKIAGEKKIKAQEDEIGMRKKKEEMEREEQKEEELDVEEIIQAVKKMKKRKAAGIDVPIEAWCMDARQ